MTTRIRRASLAALAGIIVALPLGVGTASAHVRVSSADAAPGGFGEFTFRMPNEKDAAKTTSLRVQLPKDNPFAFVSVKPVPGWTAKATTTHLATPIKAFGSTITDVVTEVAWTADAGGGLGAGQYQTFSISAGAVPKNARSLTFPALQGYDDGSVVSWVDPTVPGSAEPEHPAPTLSLAGNATNATAASPTRSGTAGLAITALIVGIVGLLLGAGGLVLALSARGRARHPVGTTTPERDAVNV